jgi:hypothetical protein
MTYNAKSDLSGTISQFTRRKSIIVNSGSSLSAYQVKLIISYESSMQTDFRNIRFNDVSGNYCPYWIESKTDNITATVWIKTDLVTGNNTVYMYYGNASITSESDGSNTFLLFDHFTGSILDSKWASVGSPTISVTNSELTISSPSWVNDRYIQTTSYTSNQNVALRTRLKEITVSNMYPTDIGWGTYHSVSDNTVQKGVQTTSQFRLVTKSGANIASSAITNMSASYKIYDLTWLSNKVELIEDGIALGNVTTYIPSASLPIMIGAPENQGGNNAWGATIDWILVRKYASSEPTACIGGEEVSTVSWLTGWNRRKLTTITGSTSGAQTDYQIKLIAHKATGTDSPTDIYLGTNVKDDFSDLRFTYNDGSTNLSYWIESYTYGSVATVWIKIPSIPISPCTMTIYLYYDNSNATPVSNGTNTFVFFDDFSGDLSKWTQVIGTSGSTISVNGNQELEISATTPSGWQSDTHISALLPTPSNGYFAQVKIKGNDLNHLQYAIAFANSGIGSNPTSGGNPFSWLRCLTTYAWDVNGSWLTPSGSPTVNVYDKFQIWYDGTNHNVSIVGKGSSTFVSTGKPLYIWLTAQVDTSRYVATFDDIFVRKYTSPEPTTCIGGEEVSTVSWLTGWGMRKLLTITGSTSGAQTDYQMKLTVHKATGTDSSTDIYLGTNVKDDFSDLRFTYNDGSTNLSYWIESYTSGSVATVWIKIPSIPTSPCTMTIYTYYSRYDASSLSNGNDTFTFFDDFTGTSLDTTKWQALGVTPTFANGIITLPPPFSYGYASGLFSKNPFPTVGYALEGSVAFEETVNNAIFSMGDIHDGVTDNRSGDWYGVVHWEISAGLRLYSYANSVELGGINITKTQGFNTYRFYNNGTNILFWVNNVSVGSVPGNSELNTNLYIRAAGYAASANDGNIKLDYIRLRKYASPEPTFSTIGTEQTAPNITATDMTITPSENPCRVGICTVLVNVTWTNNGGTEGIFTPSIKVDGTPIVVIPTLTPVSVNPSGTVTQLFTISGLSVNTHGICPDPN